MRVIVYVLMWLLLASFDAQAQYYSPHPPADTELNYVYPIYTAALLRISSIDDRALYLLEKGVFELCNLKYIAKMSPLMLGYNNELKSGNKNKRGELRRMRKLIKQIKKYKACLDNNFKI